jgi:hypothetical protein
MKNIRIFAGILFLVVTAFGCRQSSDKNSTTQNLTPKDDISISKLEDVGLDRQIITELIDSIKTGFYPNRHSLLIYKDDKLVLEEYFQVMMKIGELILELFNIMTPFFMICGVFQKV